ncbi:MAG TPA: alpha-glucan family phosphorylase [Sedimentisphaerales bacterium]|nr:alpha-glucan family phosphorylase [Sedimentisphaerales bacterium]
MLLKSIFVWPRFPEKLQPLYELAYNLWSVWNYDGLGLFYRIDTRLFRKVKHNPLKLLHSLSRERLEDLSRDKQFLSELDRVWAKFQNYMRAQGALEDEFGGKCGLAPEDTIAYLSMEFGLHESIGMYAGGLGILAGDFLKGASDLGVPVVGIGLLYKFGYFNQHIDLKGYQQEVFTRFENYLIPVKELYDSHGNWAHITVPILNEQVTVRVWQIDVGKARLILLDTDIESNPPNLRDITHQLYVGEREKRMQQELVLGLGSIKALAVCGIEPKVYHFNEGHCAFGVIGRLHDLMVDKNFSFSEARAIIRASTVFTTHTPVIAGNEHFPADLVKKYLQPYISAMGLSFDRVSEMGSINGDTNVFWLPAFAIRFSSQINAVSKQHAQQARKMWSSIFPDRPMLEIPISSIANGVHHSWISPPFIDLFNRYLGPDYVYFGKKGSVWSNIYNIPDEELWEEHRRNKRDLVNFIRRQFTEKMIMGGYSFTRMFSVNRLLNTDYLTVVFARRFAGYKRATLILTDKQRFKKILTNPARPMQIIFAGKAHPTDVQSKAMIKEIIDFAKEYQVEDRVIFIEDYDLNTAKHLHWGADVWLNNPAQDMEASGTSGMKAAMNGVLHLSTLEGWWRQGYNGRNGWAITAGNLYDKWDLQTIADANQLYDLLEHEITDLYYTRSEVDVPRVWVRMMKDLIFSVVHNFNINRTLCDYLKDAYIPAMDQTARLATDSYKLLKQAVKEEELVLRYWDNIKLVSLAISGPQKEKLTEGQTVEVRCGVNFGQAGPELFTVELFYMYNHETAYEVLPMEPKQQQANLMYYTYSLEIKGYGSQSLNVRIKPANLVIQDIHPQLIKWAD